MENNNTNNHKENINSNTNTNGNVPTEFSGIAEFEQEKIESIIIITENYIHIKNSQTESKKIDLLIEYTNLVFFAINKEQNFIFLNFDYSKDSESPQQIKFFPEISEQCIHFFLLI